MSAADSPVKRVQLADGGLLEIWLVGDTIIIRRVGGWSERLSRPEAWELAEAIDAMATAATPVEDSAP